MSGSASTTIVLQKSVDSRDLRFWVRRIWALLWLIRLIPSSAATLAFLAGLQLSKATVTIEVMAFGILSTFLVTSGCSAWNDFCDQKEDGVNVPYRPLPSRVLSARVALGYSGIAFLLTLLFGFGLGIKGLLFYGTATLASLAYSPLIKPLAVAKTLFVALFCSSLIVFGAYIGGNTLASIDAAMIVIASVAGREILIDIHDMTGDELAGHKTLPLIVGTTVCRAVITVLLVLTVLLQVRFLLASDYQYLSTILLLASTCCFLAVALVVIARSPLPKGRLLILIRVLMVAILLGVISAVMAWR